MVKKCLKIELMMVTVARGTVKIENMTIQNLNINIYHIFEEHRQQVRV